MREFLARLRLPLLFAILLLLTLASMVADRRALEASAGRDHSWWSGLLLEIAVPIQKVLTFPVEVGSDLWARYVALVDVERENVELRMRLAQVEEENLQYREALVASGHLQRIVEMREGF